jgi:hypothetical protein
MEWNESCSGINGRSFKIFAFLASVYCLICGMQWGLLFNFITPRTRAAKIKEDIVEAKSNDKTIVRMQHTQTDIIKS